MQLTEVQKDDIQSNKDIAAFSYIWIFGVVILWSRRDSQFIQFHARQSVVLFILSILIYVVPIPNFYYLNVFTVAGMITGFINANMGEYYEMPLISDVVKHHITVGWIWNFVKEKAFYCLNFIKRIFKQWPRVIVEGGVDAVSKIRGIDVLKVNAQMQELAKTVQVLNTEKTALQTQMANLEVEALASKYLLNLNFVDAPQNIQALTNEIIKQVNLKNLGFTQEDHTQYLLFKNKTGFPVLLLGNFSPEKLLILVSNPELKNSKEYSVNFNAWHGIELKEAGRELKKVLELLR